MAESSTSPQPLAPSMQVCEKCRQNYPLEQFAHGVADQACVCIRCMKVMGYKVP